ncbi:Cytochrome c oxidase subunit 3 [Symmachiella dynata]|uniref:Cytochrome bo(3) ubiquinol oxidase subunit 3 n=1 Tax=Symmachiella dynata TaxID=2527995 RepID=A0A517ZXU6_9PLAN|nr:cytochrome c oxidase subunit 3 [Symmachiella dynata]QDU47266.1 Cytochrome c oxidase subunit 3 [Symmachiella dynata]
MSEIAHTTSGELAAPPQGWEGEGTSHLDPKKVGMACFLCSEAAFFMTLLVGYGLYLGRDLTGPTPAEVLSMPLVIVNTILLLSSSITIALAMKRYEKSEFGQFRLFLGLTIFLGAAFIVGTGIEWKGLIEDHGLTISRNLFGTTFYTLIGFHATHVTIGLIMMSTLLGIQAAGRLGTDSPAAELISWYWHFVDGVWIVVFCLVYVFGR